MPAHDLDLLIDAARKAGDVARGFVGKTAQRWDKPDNAGPVTEADLAVNDLLHETLIGARPDYGWLSEETEDSTARLDRERVFIVDPIDGTRSFVEGSNTWAHSIAVAEAGVVTAAVVYLPMRDKLYAASLDGGATLNAVPIRADGEDQIARMTVLAARPTMAVKHWRGAVSPTFQRTYRPSLAYRLALVAEGRFDGMLTLRPTWEWDIAAGTLIVTEAGGGASDRLAAPLRFNNADPRTDGVVAGSAHAHAALTSALA
ncbi:3'(2'),5'-bisphosphate nucleotidase CysQ [Sulfitobacter aestuariivivens]|uniref:3'(2'),5'-bisphosphate nucleotidase CysQ n=1 Tax=Sulfitobacter aestuariivivens TaxID=2766981 RepID=A0A927DAG0_9RHOB|nr:3'(2'),5'-bisphosphate nucleotidase CysQ [Sulfitobacter aestuariivivens]MBD3665656.1 3'(2'),5'-bisphosphate nucleotidase CysQ [Sulfitobacter aestuariivivens]